MGARELDRLREIAQALPEINERESHGSPCFFLRDKKPLAYFHDHDGTQQGGHLEANDGYNRDHGRTQSMAHNDRSCSSPDPTWEARARICGRWRLSC